MGILDFMLYALITIVLGAVAIYGIDKCNETDKIEEENRRLKEIITKNNYKI